MEAKPSILYYAPTTTYGIPEYVLTADEMAALVAIQEAYRVLHASDEVAVAVAEKLIRCKCGCLVPASRVLRASTGTSCQNHYDSMS